MATGENLKAAFAGESQANQRYLAYAEQARQEGFSQVAKLFRAAARAEAVHARAFLKTLGTVRPTAENLQEAVNGESFEFKDLYPRYEATAMEENQPAAVLSFQNALAVEQVHHSLFIEAMGKVKAGQDLRSRRMFVCCVCGNTVVDEPPETCPVCSSPRDKYEEIE
jgi:rubrerythrin